MKKYRLSEQNTLVGILQKLKDKPLSSSGESQAYTVTDVIPEKDIMNSVSVFLTSNPPPMGKPSTLTSIQKENRVELRVKQANPYQDDYYTVSEIIIEPMERSADRTQIKNIDVWNIFYAPQTDLSTLLSLYGKSSTIQQSLNHFQLMMEHFLNQHGYFITKSEVQFFYSINSALLDVLSEVQAPFFIRDTYSRSTFKGENFMSAENPKLKPKDLEILMNKLSLDNIKSVLFVPFYSSGGTLIGFIELHSNLPNLGNESLGNPHHEIKTIQPLMRFLEMKAEELIFELESSYIKEWKSVSNKEEALDLSQDGRGIGILFNQPVTLFSNGAKVAFSIMINSVEYIFYGTVRNLKPMQNGSGTVAGIRIFNCSIQDGMNLLEAYASKILAGNFHS